MVDKGVCAAKEFRAKLRPNDQEDGRAGGRGPVG
jgi:hypothetical protein